jgi:hypothetical protein
MRQIGLLLYCLCVFSARAASVAVPNYSFENPPTAFADTNIVDWVKSPTPFWYDETANGPWAQLTGVFANSPPDSPNNDHIVNCDGNQGAFLFALPGVALFQDQAAATNSTFNPTFDVNKAYDLTVGVIGNGGGMSNGVTLQLWIYYRDASSNMIPIAATTVTNSDTQFPDRNHFIDFTAHLPIVQATDPWAGKNIGVEIISTVDFSLAGGYWDLDNVRLISSQKPALSRTAASNNQLTFTVSGEPGAHLQILSSTDISLASTNWTTVATLTNDTGTVSITNSITANPARFYQALQVP